MSKAKGLEKEIADEVEALGRALTKLVVRAADTHEERVAGHMVRARVMELISVALEYPTVREFARQTQQGPCRADRCKNKAAFRGWCRVHAECPECGTGEGNHAANCPQVE